jgi:hypothetical protein
VHVAAESDAAAQDPTVDPERLELRRDDRLQAGRRDREQVEGG